MFAGSRERLWWWSAVALAALGGLCLRVAGAQGGLWTDEAWSVIYAAQARDAAGVFLRINHDNNHHLYSLWLQAIGMGAPPWLARLPAILAGTAAIPLAATLVGRRSLAAGMVAAILFAIAPPMLAFGSEARGYALMILAALLMLMVVTRSIERRPAWWAPWCLGLIAALGMLSHMTMAAVVGLTTLWVYLDRRSAIGPNSALGATVRLMGPALGATVAVVIFVFAAAAASPTGMRLGGYLVFTWADYAAALDAISGWSIGASAIAPWLGPVLVGAVAVALAVKPPEWLGSRATLYALLILGVPVGIGLLHPGNAGFSRYYLSSAIGLLLLVSEWLGRGLNERGSIRYASAAALAVVMLVSAWHDSQLLESQRGHPDEAFRIIAARAPDHASVQLLPGRFEGMLTVAASQTGYALAFARGCQPANFVVAARPVSTGVPQAIVRCGVTMRALGSALGTPLTGEGWIVYGVEGLQTAKAPVSGPAPGTLRRGLSDRAGVAQG